MPRRGHTRGRAHRTARAHRATRRRNPFAPKDTFCTKTGPPATKNPIKVVQIRSQLEKYEPLGYSLPVGDVNDMYQVFTDQINACGGIRGRKVELQNEEYDPTNPASRDAACIAATEDDKAFVVVNANTLTGTGPYCVAGDHKTPLVYVGGATDAQYKETNGRIASYGPSANGQVRLLAEDLIASGALKGKKVAIASTDLPDQVDVVQESLVAPLKKAGVKVVAYDVLPCQGAIVCTQPIPQSVMKVAGTKPDVVIPVMTATTLPVYVNEMQKAGMKAKVYETSYNALGTDLVQSKVLQVGGPDLAKYYDGATRGLRDGHGRLASPRLHAAAHRHDVQRRVLEAHEDRRLLRAEHRGLHEVGHGRVVVHQHADGRTRHVRRRPQAHAAVVRGRAAQAPRRSDRWHRRCAGGRVHRWQDHAEHRVRERGHLSVQAARAARRHDLPHPEEHQGAHDHAMTSPARSTTTKTRPSSERAMPTPANV